MFKNIDDIRQVEWDQGYLWDIKFIELINPSHKSKLSSPFDEWFPANSVNDERFSITEHPIDLHQYAGFPFPNGSSQRSITIGFYDDIKNTLLKWITKWVKTDILNDGKYLTTLTRCTKQLQIVKLNSQREQVDTFSYLVIPSGSIEYQGTEQSDSTVYSVRFLIVGEEIPPTDTALAGEPTVNVSNIA